MYLRRRQSIRDSWLPALTALPMAAHAFVVSKPQNESILAAIREEEKTYGAPFMVLDTEVLPFAHLGTYPVHRNRND
jgi:hypothetical protein